MKDRQVSVICVAAVALWAGGLAVLVVGIAGQVFGLPALGLLLAGTGATIQIRGFVLRLEGRLRDAFEMGRDYERGEAKVRPLR